MLYANENNGEAAPFQRRAPGQTSSLQAASGCTVHCVGGTLWLTQSGDPRDFILRAGQSWTAPRRGRVVLQPLNGEARWTVRQAGESPLGGVLRRLRHRARRSTPPGDKLHPKWIKS